MTGKDNTMTKFFMRGTPLAGLEKQMMTPPNYTPRGGGRMILNRFRYRPEDVVCKNCIGFKHRKPCTFFGDKPFMADTDRVCVQGPAENFV